MIQERERPRRDTSHWFGEQVTEEIDATVGDIAVRLPAFDRAPLDGNVYKHVIRQRDGSVAVGVVSSRYDLIQHGEVVAQCVEAAAAASIDARSLPARLTLTQYGTRMALRITLPRQYALEPPDGHALALTFECFNSVDGSVPLYALVGWFRFVCANGLAVGTTTARYRRKHVPSARERSFAGVLAAGIQEAAAERDAFVGWSKVKIRPDAIERWLDGPVAKAWGPLAAARAFHIVTTGRDGTPRGLARHVPPHARPLIPAGHVPGTSVPCDDKFAVAQVLSWIASRRNSVAERDAWRAQIGGLVEALP